MYNAKAAHKVSPFLKQEPLKKLGKLMTFCFYSDSLVKVGAPRFCVDLAAV